MPTVSINGKLCLTGNALLHIDERGFRFGDGVFETISVHADTPYLLAYHLERLSGGLKALHISYDTSSLPSEIEAVIRANEATQGIIRVHVSRGIGSMGYLPNTPPPAPTTVIQYMPAVVPPQEPVSLWFSTWRKIAPDALPTRYKLAQGINPTLARMEAREQHCHDALQLSAQGHVSEASSANIFWLKDGTLYTPALTTGALAGVTRRRVMELSPHPVLEITAGLETLSSAEEVFLTNASAGIIPVGALLPQGYKWVSHSCAMHLSALRTQDICENTRMNSKNLP